MGDNWRENFSVDVINGTPGNELKFQGRRLITTYLRVGYDPEGSWRTFGLRRDFHPAHKMQAEDDISASVVVPTEQLAKLNEEYHQPSVKFVQNCEYRASSNVPTMRFIAVTTNRRNWIFRGR